MPQNVKEAGCVRQEVLGRRINRRCSTLGHRGGYGEVLNATVISVRNTVVVVPEDGKLDLEAIGVTSKEAQNPPTRAGHPVHTDYTTIVSVYNADYAKVNRR